MIGRSLPLRMRLALGYAAFFALVLILLGLGVYLAVRQALLHEMERQLQTSSDLIEQDFDASNSSLKDYFDDSTFLLRTHPSRIEGLESPSLYVQALTTDGAIAITTASLHGQHLPINGALKVAMTGQEQIDETELGSAHILMLMSPLRDANVIVGVLQVAQPLREIENTLRLLLISLAATGLIALLAVIRGGAWLAGGALQPVGQIAETTRQIVYAEDLARRVKAAPTNDEIGQLTETINEMLERLEQLFKAQRRFVGDVSHELRTPLTAMRGNLELLRHGVVRDPQAVREALADMEREVNRLTRLVSDLLLLAQAESGMLLRPEPLVLDDLLLEIVRELQPLTNGVILMPQIDEQVELIGDRDRLKQALLNVVVNALQHTPPGGRVRVALARDERQARISVSDTGEGIAAADLPYIFDRFYRADKARSRRTGGAGLGLAIAKWVIEAHDGSIEVVSAPGEGSTFTLVLPLNDQHQPTSRLLKYRAEYEPAPAAALHTRA
jgi:signal transduction histidine kinase